MNDPKVFDELPRSRHGGGQSLHEERLALLQAHEGKWVVLKDTSNGAKPTAVRSTAGNWKRSFAAAGLPKSGRLEFVCRTAEDGVTYALGRFTEDPR